VGSTNGTLVAHIQSNTVLAELDDENGRVWALRPGEKLVIGGREVLVELVN
jgi:hypothetical protein